MALFRERSVGNTPPDRRFVDPEDLGGFSHGDAFDIAPGSLCHGYKDALTTSRAVEPGRGTPSMPLGHAADERRQKRAAGKRALGAFMDGPTDWADRRRRGWFDRRRELRVRLERVTSCNEEARLAHAPRRGPTLRGADESTPAGSADSGPAARDGGFGATD